jgi:hypothetical protein
MSGKHVTTVKGDRIEVECQNCKTSMNVSATGFLSAGMLENWPKLHKCPKVRK